MSPVVQLPVTPQPAQAAAKGASRVGPQGGDATPAGDAEGAFAALLQQLAAPAQALPDPTAASPSPEAGDALAQDAPPTAAAPAQADPALLAMVMASQAMPQAAAPLPGVSLRGPAPVPETDAQGTLDTALDTRTLPQGAGRAGPTAALERDALVPRDAPGSPAVPAVPAPALIAEAALTASRSHTASQAVEGLSLEPPTPAPLPLAAPHAPPAAAASAVLEASLLARPGEPRFASELATQLQVMVDGEIEHARLQLHPAELGPIQITMTVQAQTADIQFHAAHAGTRQGLQDGLEELRRLLGEMGLQLGQANVGAGQQQQQQHDPASHPPGTPRSASTAPGGGAGAGSEVLRPGRSVRETLGLLDLYA